jgi:hypothetical protein
MGFDDGGTWRRENQNRLCVDGDLITKVVGSCNVNAFSSGAAVVIDKV